MAGIYEIKERRVIPNWRDFKRTLALGELNALDNSINPLDIDIQRSMNDWKTNKNFGTATDLLNSAFVSDKRNVEISNAANYLFENHERASRSLLEIGEIVSKESFDVPVKESENVIQKDVTSIAELNSFISDKELHELVSKAKLQVRRSPRNAFAWIELARLYSILGLIEKAESAVFVALHLAPDNRYILRSATRFFTHTEEIDKALFYLKKSETLLYDPWLISAHISASSVADKFSPLINAGKTIIASGNFSDFDLTELSSSIGTLEFKDGSFKRAKEFIGQSLKSPNDNSLAQMEWVAKQDHRLRGNKSVYNHVANPFEALAINNFVNGKWWASYENALKWLSDTPYSVGPALLGSYITGSLLNDPDSAVALCDFGLKANPTDPMLLNSLLYNLVVSGRPYEQVYSRYIKNLADVKFNNLSEVAKVTLQATTGLVAFRKGDIETGVRLYELSIKNSSNLGNDYLRMLATVNYTRELILVKHEKRQEYLKRLKNMTINENHKDLKILRDKVLALTSTGI